MTKRVFVKDSFYTEQIVDILKGVYGDEVKVFSGENTEILPLSYFDLYFLSGQLILDGNFDLSWVKRTNPNAKIVAMSVSPGFLKDIKSQGYPVDFFYNKDHFIFGDGPIYKLPQAEIDLLKSYLE